MKNKIIFLGIIAAGLTTGCNMNKDKNSADTISAGSDSSMMTANDTSLNHGTTVLPTDTATAGSKINAGNTGDAAVSEKKVDMAKPDASKKGKKGRVSIVINEAKGTGEMNMDKEGYYSSTEILPAFPGGQKALENFFEKNIEYPADATDNGIEGTVNMNFAVDEKGKVYAPKITSDNIGYGIEKESLRVFAKMPTWTPGQIKGKNVKTRYTLPIKFQLY